MSDRGATGGRWGCPQGTRGAAQTIILSLLLTTAAFAGRAVPCPLGNLSQRAGGFGTTDAETTFFDHGPRGELRRLTQPTSGGNRPASVFEYPDDSHRLSKVTRGTDVVSFDYDGNSTRVSAVKKGSGVPLDATVTRSYTSPTKRLSSITGAWGTTYVAWERGGARLSSLNGGLADEAFCFDGPGRIQSIDTGGGNCLSPSSSVRVYSYDGRGNPTAEAYGGVTRHFGYDAADRLTSSTDWSGVSTSISPHPDGTRNTELVGGELHTYDYDSNTGALSAVRNGSTTLAAWSYLNDGRVSSRTIGSSTSTYAWDGFGRLVSATTSAGTSTFEYDALGLRRASSLNGVPTSSFTWVGESQVAEGSELVSSVGPFLLSQGNVRFTHDALGSIVGQSKLQPAPLLPLTSSAVYGTWGAQSGGTQLTSNSHAGQRLESALGLVENQQRWRDPIFGVWLSRDSVGAASYLSTPNSIGPWSYANLSPLRYTDPDGRVIVDEASGEVTVEENDTSEDLMVATAVYAKHISPDRRAQMGRILEANEFASARGELSPEEHEKQDRAAIYSALRLGIQDARSGQLGERQDQAVLEADMKPRGKRIVRKMREISKEGYEATELAAGLLGVPTSKTDVGLMVIPYAGGVLRLTKSGFRSVFGLLMRNSAEDAGKVLSRVAGTKGFEGVEFIEGHIGAGSFGPKGGKAPWNPSPRWGNCVNTVCAFLDSVQAKTLKVEEALKDVAWNGGKIDNALTHIRSRVSAKTGRAQFKTLQTAKDEQFFVVFAGSNPNISDHVLVGITKKQKDGSFKSVLYDPQSHVTHAPDSFGSFMAYPLMFTE